MRNKNYLMLAVLVGAHAVGGLNRIYRRTTGYERVKYGVLNIVQDPNGVLACRGYGDSYLLLKSETVRLRTSFASRDTGGGTAKLASCEWYCHGQIEIEQARGPLSECKVGWLMLLLFCSCVLCSVLSEYADPELIDVISVATKKKM